MSKLRRQIAHFAPKTTIDGLTDIFNQELSRNREDLLELQNQTRELGEQIPVGSNWDDVARTVETQSASISRTVNSLSSINNSILVVTRRLNDIAHRLEECEQSHLQLADLVTAGGLETFSFGQVQNPNHQQQRVPPYGSDRSRGRNTD